MAKKKGDKKRVGKAQPAKPAAKTVDTEKDAPKVASTAEPETPDASEGPEEDESPSSEPAAATPAPAKRTPASGELRRAAWGRPAVIIDRKWTWFEERLLFAVIMLLVAQLTFWVVLKGIQEPVHSESAAGTVLRGMVGIVFFGSVGYWGTGRLGWSEQRRGGAALAGICLGAGLAPMWRSVGVEYWGHVFNWLQEGSSLSMFGGLRGVSTRLTILLAMIGASLAAAGGKHINIDVLLRFVNPKLRLPSFVASTVATIGVCAAMGIGFFDYIAVDAFGAKREWDRGAKIDRVTAKLSQDFFLYRKQVGFDLQAVPVVLGGGKWDDETRLNGRQWNEFLETSGYRQVFKKEQVDALMAPERDLDGSRLAMAVGPEGMPRNLLVKTLNLTFMVGFFVLAFRFLLKLIIVLSGHEKMALEGEEDEQAEQDQAAADDAAAAAEGSGA